MASASRDRVTIDLRGIGPSVRAAASARHLRVAAYARLGLRNPSESHFEPRTGSFGLCKQRWLCLPLCWRMRGRDGLGAKLVHGTAGDFAVAGFDFHPEVSHLAE